MLRVQAESNQFLELFYDKYIAQLIAVLSDACEPGRQQSDAPGAAPSALALIVDLLCFCVQQHSYRIQCAPSLPLSSSLIISDLKFKQNCCTGIAEINTVIESLDLISVLPCHPFPLLSAPSAAGCELPQARLCHHTHAIVLEFDQYTCVWRGCEQLVASCADVGAYDEIRLACFSAYSLLSADAVSAVCSIA